MGIERKQQKICVQKWVERERERERIYVQKGKRIVERNNKKKVRKLII